MNKQDRKTYLEKYKAAKEKGVPFFPDVIFKDAVASFLVFIALVALAFFLGAPLEDRANPNDTSYTPRPEWYFLFLFQMLKYFPGKLEVIGAIIIPSILIVLLLVLPFIDKSALRHFRNRPYASVTALVIVAGIGLLTVLAVREPPPPQAAIVVDQAAALYTQNCANCHGPNIEVPSGTDLHQIIASGRHEGMPAWGGDLSTDEIDSLAGFILSPSGHIIYNQQCAQCHEQMVQAVGNPAELQRMLEEGPEYEAHAGLGVPQWNETLSPDEHNALLNFLAAPDGQRLFAVNCSGCHGEGVAFSGSNEELRRLVSEGGQHLDMPAWKENLSDEEINALVAFVVNPEPGSYGEQLFEQYCVVCHGTRLPSASDTEQARNIISTGGAHITMPVWGDILTPEQLDALVEYTYAASKGGGPAAGARLYAENCSVCHGLSGEGGPNPARAGDIIAPISSGEYLTTRNDATLRNIISQGQPDFGMSPFGDSNGGPLTSEQIDAIVAFIRSWETNPPVVLPPEVSVIPEPTWTSAQVFTLVCASCHGIKGEGDIGPALNTAEFQARYDDQALIEIITSGHESTPMIGWGEMLSSDQIQQLAEYIQALPPGNNGESSPTTEASFSEDVYPILQEKCQVCHNASTKLGGWDASSYEAVITSGDHGPAVIPGDAMNSLLAQRIQGIGNLMPPSGSLPQEEIQAILDWIAAGAEND
jgi:mono/diheme cytochrome c family protein